MNSLLQSARSQPTVDQAGVIASGWFIVTQVKCNRIVYFTDDPDYTPASDGDWYFVTHYLGEMPEGMTLANCWGWRFNGGKFTDAREPVAREPHEALLESNRRALFTLLRQKVDQTRARWAPTCSMGGMLRQRKLEEARRYRAAASKPESVERDDDFDLLRSVAVAHGVTLDEAADLILRLDREMLQSLTHSEQIREHYSQAIRNATNQDELIRLRRNLLSERWQTPIMTTPVSPPMNPADWHTPLGAVQRANEIVRLQGQLRQIVNERRARVLGHYAGNDLLTQYKTTLANQILNGGAGAAGQDLQLIESYAAARNLSLEDAARLMLGAAEEAQQVLIGTEVRKDRLLARIEAIKTLSDVREIGLELDSLAKSMRGDEARTGQF
ncbi:MULTISPECIES: hypothetical protein [Burkholderia]|uniref:Uncharacterized protein n=1 Tax=Burkholderia paludis TaxID=1506587 RepID=A0A6J5E2S3_9BURK|nr:MULTISPECIES: hypothetical protein [Burkholderia]CAB3759964.1 hypothetical protein LMG30113_03571 [Burkholderia paludis]VWC43474.1 hypothetical protein BPA30113_07104 [Burkholderia paludis]